MWIFIYLIKVISLKQNLSILLYEKEKILNSILYYQISKNNNYDLLIVENDEELHKTVADRSFDACILNLNNLNDNGYISKNELETIYRKNKSEANLEFCVERKSGHIETLKFRKKVDNFLNKIL